MNRRISNMLEPYDPGQRGVREIISVFKSNLKRHLFSPEYGLISDYL